VIDSFRHKGLEELHRTGKTRRIGAASIRKCLRLLHEHCGLSIPRFGGQTASLVGARNGELPSHFRLARRGWMPSSWISKIITKRGEPMKQTNGLPAIHPGEIIREDILPETGLSVAAAARALGVSRQMLHEILAERRPLSAVMCLKVAKLFGSTATMWMRLQAAYDLKKAEQNQTVMQGVARIVPVKPIDPMLTP